MCVLMLNYYDYQDDFKKLNINEEDSTIILAYIDVLADIAIEYYNEIKLKHNE